MRTLPLAGDIFLTNERVNNPSTLGTDDAFTMRVFTSFSFSGAGSLKCLNMAMQAGRDDTK